MAIVNVKEGLCRLSIVLFLWSLTSCRTRFQERVAATAEEGVSAVGLESDVNDKRASGVVMVAVIESDDLDVIASVRQVLEGNSIECYIECSLGMCAVSTAENDAMKANEVLTVAARRGLAKVRVVQVSN